MGIYYQVELNLAERTRIEDYMERWLDTLCGTICDPSVDPQYAVWASKEVTIAKGILAKLKSAPSTWKTEES